MGNNKYKFKEKYLLRENKVNSTNLTNKMNCAAVTTWPCDALLTVNAQPSSSVEQRGAILLSNDTNPSVSIQCT